MAKNKMATNLFTYGKKAALLALFAVSPLVPNKAYTPNDFEYIKAHQQTAAQITSTLPQYKENFGYNDKNRKAVGVLCGLEGVGFFIMYLIMKIEDMKKKEKRRIMKKMQRVRVR